MSLSDAPSASLTVTLTVELAGPSGKRAVEAARAGRGVERVGADLVPPVPQLGRVEDERVVTRIADREAVGVGGALVDRGRARSG